MSTLNRFILWVLGPTLSSLELTSTLQGSLKLLYVEWPVLAQTRLAIVLALLCCVRSRVQGLRHVLVPILSGETWLLEVLLHVIGLLALYRPTTTFLEGYGKRCILAAVTRVCHDARVAVTVWTWLSLAIIFFDPSKRLSTCHLGAAFYKGIVDWGGVLFGIVFSDDSLYMGPLYNVNTL